MIANESFCSQSQSLETSSIIETVNTTSQHLMSEKSNAYDKFVKLKKNEIKLIYGRKTNCLKIVIIYLK